MAKYKVGDMVKVREDLVPGVHYGGVLFINSMRMYKGSIQNVRYVGETGAIYRFYRIGDFRNIFDWSEEMLEPVEEGIIPAAENPPVSTEYEEDILFLEDNATGDRRLDLKTLYIQKIQSMDEQQLINMACSINCLYCPIPDDFCSSKEEENKRCSEIIRDWMKKGR